jgi:hypothetical protein
MDQAEQENIRRAIEADYAQEIAAAKAKRAERLRALSIVCAVPVPRTDTDQVSAASQPSSPPSQTSEPESSELPRIQRGTITSLIRKVAKAQPRVFDMRDVYHGLKQENAELGAAVKLASISSALQRMADDGVLAVHFRGGGKRPTLYQVKRADGHGQLVPSPEAINKQEHDEETLKAAS